MALRKLFRRLLDFQLHITPLLSRAFRAAPNLVARGRLAESHARRWLEDNGLEIVAANLVTPLAEIDLVAIENDVLCIVEVKARYSARFGKAIEAVTLQKQRRLARAGVWLTANLPWNGPVRFDVLALDRNDHDEWSVVHHRAAFEAISEDAS